MKNIIKYIGFAISIVILTQACSKDIKENGTDWGALSPSKLDTNAGSWKPVVLLMTDTFSIGEPEAQVNYAYKGEITELKQALAGQTPEQKTAIAYWSAGSVLRWNEIMRSLVAKYNFPVQDSAGGYRIPDSNNPFAYPQFPFSNPPYAARAYSYIAIAQYDALCAAHKLKSKYKRTQAYIADPSIVPSVPKSSLYAYPNEDAVIASVSLEMMKFLFPTEVVYLNQKANEAKYFKFWAGAAVKSDIVAGDSLGKLVAARILARAKTDGMKNAIGNQVKWDSLNTVLLTRRDNGRDTVYADKGWRSQDNPYRPPMLPFFGAVKGWFFSSAASVRVAPPPSTSSAVVQTQMDELLGYSKNVSREQLGIVNFWADGVGTQTPPGHWNAIAADYFQKAQWSEVRTARNFALLNMSMMDAAITCWDNKYFYYYPRPSQLNRDVKTWTGVPNFPSYTSGHSTFSGAASTILGHILPSEKSNLDAMAKQASESRIYGCIHFRMDCEVGLISGVNIGRLAVARAVTDGAE
jgi:hypothetical protein